jgi:alpha-mannosidase
LSPSAGATAAAARQENAGDCAASAKGHALLPESESRKGRDFLGNLYNNIQDSLTCRMVGELYLEYHRGTYTSAARNKKNNRKSDFYTRTSIYLLYGGESDFPSVPRRGTV